MALSLALPPTMPHGLHLPQPASPALLPAQSRRALSRPVASLRNPSPRLRCLPSTVLSPPTLLSTRTARRALDVRAMASSYQKAKSLIPSHGFDFYELLGLQPDAKQEDVKKTYRRLQKRCHPDVAGREDMAILLNDAYSVLSDPISRFTYDQLRVTWVKDDTFSGQPVYSMWHGSEEEEVAVFVDEMSCIGCLNCALQAPNTFAIECKHGRARAVRQWADDEPSINAAIESCPVSCIKWVERSKLAALEHVMSTLPRPSLYSIMVGGSGISMPDVFNETDKFLQKRKKKEGDIEEARASREKARGAFDAIRGWWGGGASSSGGAHPSSASSDPAMALVLAPRTAEQAAEEAAEYARAARNARRGAGGDGDFVPDDLRALHSAASANKGTGDDGFFSLRVGEDMEEYWDPSKPLSFVDKTQWAAPAPAPAPSTSTSTAHRNSAPATSSAATAAATGAAGAVGLKDAPGASGGRVSERSGPRPQFIAAEEWPDYAEEMRRAKTEKVDYALSLLPIFVSIAAGAYVWLAPEASDPQSQAAAVAALQASAGNALVPPEVVASAGLRMALCMVVWYATGAAVAGACRMAISALLGWNKEG